MHNFGPLHVRSSGSFPSESVNNIMLNLMLLSLFQGIPKIRISIELRIVHIHGAKITKNQTPLPRFA